jgi:thioesterase domain-containing protein
MIGLISSTDGQADSLLMVFLFPGLSGDVTELDAFLGGCGPAVNFVLIDYPGWPTLRRDEIGLDTLIGHCRSQIEDHAPFGPVTLVGYSFGGHMAFAVAVALSASGRSVRLGLLDTWAFPVLTNPYPRSVMGQLRRIANGLFRGQRGVMQRAVNIVGRRIMHSAKILQLAAKLYRRPSRRMFKLVDVALQMSFHVPIMRELLDRMVALTAPFHFEAILFRCSKQPANAAVDLGWGPFLENLRIVPILGNHLALFEPPYISSLCATVVATIGDTATERVKPEGYPLDSG